MHEFVVVDGPLEVPIKPTVCIAGNTAHLAVKVIRVIEHNRVDLASDERLSWLRPSLAQPPEDSGYRM